MFNVMCMDENFCIQTFVLENALALIQFRLAQFYVVNFRAQCS